MTRHRPSLVPLLLCLSACSATLVGEDAAIEEEEKGDAAIGGVKDARAPSRDRGVADAGLRIDIRLPLPDAIEPADLTAPKVPSYPAGPYGNQVGDILQNMVLAGYRLTPQQRDPSALGWATDIAFQEFHDNPACSCLLISIAASSCGICAQEQPYLVREVAADPAFCVLNILEEGLKQGVWATKQDVDNWVNKYKQNFFVVQGNATTKTLKKGYGPTIKLPFNFIVRPDTMKIRGVVQGFDTRIHTKAMSLCQQ